MIEQRITELKNPISSFTTEVDRILDHNSFVPIKSTFSKDLKLEKAPEASSMPASHSTHASKDISASATNSSSIQSYNAGARRPTFLTPYEDEEGDGKTEFLISYENQQNANASSPSLNRGAFLISTEVYSQKTLEIAQMQEINASAHLLNYYEGFTNLFSQALVIVKAGLNGTLALDRANLEKSIAAKALWLIPFCEVATGSTVEDIAAFVQSIKFQGLAKKFAKLAQDSGNFEEMVQQVAREVVLNSRTKTILNDGREEEVLSIWLGNLTQQCRKSGVELSAKIFGETYESDAAKLGYKDACRLINMWVSRKIELDDWISIAESFAKVAIEQASIGSDEQCVVMMVIEIKYDNPLLNYPALIDAFSKTHTAEVISHLINLTTELSHDSRDAIEEICNSNNAIDMLCMLVGEDSFTLTQ